MLGVEPVNCLVIEDAKKGILAANAAGIPVILLNASAELKADAPSVGSIEDLLPTTLEKLYSTLSSKLGGKMRVMIAGSKPPELTEDQFGAFCQDVAEELARRNVTVILGSERSDTADYYVFSRLQKLRAGCQIKFFYHEAKAPPFVNSIDGLNVKYQRVTGGWGACRIPQIAEADVIITIGGGEKTAILATIAYYLHKPVVPVFASGGASVRIWEHVRPLFDGKALTRSLVNDIETWKGQISAKAVLDLAEKAPRIVNDWPWRKLLFTYLMIVFFIPVWLGCFYQEFLAPQKSLFLLTISACMIGSFIPIFRESMAQDSLEISWQTLLLRPVSALVMGFVIYITYLFSGYVVNGDLNFFTDLDKMQHFRRVSLVVTIVGTL